MRLRPLGVALGERAWPRVVDPLVEGGSAADDLLELPGVPGLRGVADIVQGRIMNKTEGREETMDPSDSCRQSSPIQRLSGENSGRGIIVIAVKSGHPVWRGSLLSCI